jgi:hypothetical protein
VTETSREPGRSSAVEISDVFVVESSCHVRRDFNQMESFENVTFQHRLLPDKEGVTQVRTDAPTGDEITIIRYFIDGGLRVLRPEFSPSTDPTPEDVLAEISVKLAVDARNGRTISAAELSFRRVRPSCTSRSADVGRSFQLAQM